MHHRYPLTTRIVAVAAFVLAAAGSVVYANVRTYRSLLHDSDVYEVVTVDSSRYVVENEHVTKNAVSVDGISALRARRIAYHTALARRDPLYAIPGTDPAQLASSTDRLHEALRVLVDRQTDETERLATAHLYAIAFLNSAAQTESARQELIHDPTEANLHSYLNALSTTRRAHLEDLQQFSESFSRVVVEDDQRITLFSGVLTATSERASISALQEAAHNTAHKLLRRERCAQGVFWECEHVPSVRLATIAPRPLPDVRIATEVGSLWSSAGATGTTTPVILSRSACMPRIENGMRFVFRDQGTRTGTVRIFSYADNVFFNRSDVSKDFAYSVYARTVLRMTYTPINPFKYYSCPQLGIDFGAATAVQAIRTYARSHTSIAPNERRALLDGAPSDTAATAYIQAALQNTSGITRNDIEEYRLMLERKSAGLNYIIDDMAHIIQTDTQEGMNHVLDTSTRIQFLTHSAYPTLFRIGVADDGFLDPLFSFPKDAIDRFDRDVYSYTELRKTTSRTVLVHDLRAFLNFENRNTNTAPATTPATNSSAN